MDYMKEFNLQLSQNVVSNSQILADHWLGFSDNGIRANMRLFGPKFRAYITLRVSIS